MDQLNFALLLLAVITVYDVSAAETFNVYWNYNNNSNIGPWNWKNFSSKCSGNRQSPIDIVTANVKDNDNLGPLVLGNYKDIMKDLIFELKNHGHAVNVELHRFNSFTNSPVTITYRGVSWRFVQFHFHFGSTNDQGSEHTIDGKAYPAEIHMIHYNTKYSSLSDAIKNEDGLLVWGTLFEVGSSTNNTHIDAIISRFNNVEFEGSVSNITSFPTINLIPEGSENSYYTYLGSLTTPTCDESVRWIVNTKTITITTAQMAEFRKLRQTHNASNPTLMYNNYRPTLPINGRIVERYSGGSFVVNSSLINFFIPFLFLLITHNM